MNLEEKKYWLWISCNKGAWIFALALHSRGTSFWNYNVSVLLRDKSGFQGVGLHIKQAKNSTKIKQLEDLMFSKYQIL